MRPNKNRILVTAEQKAEEMIRRYESDDAKIQAKQILCFIDDKDIKTKNYWKKVLILLEHSHFLQVTVTEREAQIKKILNKC